MIFVAVVATMFCLFLWSLVLFFVLSPSFTVPPLLLTPLCGRRFIPHQVQLVSGASPLAYWVSAYLWDVALFFVLTVLVMLTFAAYGRDASKVGYPRKHTNKMKIK